MATAALKRYTPEEYLDLERHAEFKSEYIDGHVIAMSPGADRPHLLISHNLSRELGNRLLDGPCEIYEADMKVKIEPSGRYVYPDLCVSCDPRFEKETTDVLLTPVLIIEVLSESTEKYDRGEKFFHYRRIPSLREYVLLAQNECLVERYVRDGDFWRYTALDDPDASLVLGSLDIEIPLRRIYAKVLPAAPPGLGA